MNQSLMARSPLDERLADAPASEALAMSQAEDVVRLSLRVREAERPQLESALNLSLPIGVSAMTHTPTWTAMCLGPDEWLLHVQAEAAPALLAQSTEAYASIPHSLVDISDRELGVVVQGRHAADALNAACPRDLLNMADGSAVRTVFDGLSVVLVKHGADHFQLEAWRSHAAHIWDMLAATAPEFEALD